MLFICEESIIPVVHTSRVTQWHIDRTHEMLAAQKTCCITFTCSLLGE